MGIAYYLDKQHGVTFSVWDGTVTAQDWLDQIRSATTNPGWPAGKLWLSDTSSVRDVSTIDAADIEKAAERICEYREQIEQGNVAIVAHDTFRKARMFEKFLSLCGPNVIVFNELVTAAGWLGIDPAVAGAVTQRLRAELRGQPTAGSASTS
jgi:hypothetical protein